MGEVQQKMLQQTLDKEMEKIVQEKINDLFRKKKTKIKHGKMRRRTKIGNSIIKIREPKPIRISALDSISGGETDNKGVETWVKEVRIIHKKILTYNW